ncbi:type I polyketide synthase (plasmid) [Streptomyces sp. AHU1]|uniref:type I polyketide synthase n=1 Tax=Streptomyces sp. AHU1 TaxID=3377215 RepID=UPI0038779399
MSYENAVALIGMSGRFPGARDLEKYWHNLRTGADSISRFSRAELLAAGVDPVLAGHPDFVPAAGIVPDGDRFDRAFFGYSAAEATGIDPQHRLFLECAAQALDDAGLDPHRCGEWTGVYAGCDHTPAPTAGPVDPAAATQRVIGREKDFLATRVAYKLGLRGPAVTVQTACSTGLVAVHQACRALLGYECDIALAGASSVRPLQTGGYLYQEGSILSADGRCRPFDADATGTVSSGGIGVVVLKRLADALADSDRIIAVIRGSAINNDGDQKVGYTAPSVSGQRAVIQMALAQAGVDPSEIGYVEAHGTGTPVGDPIEIAALKAAFTEYELQTVRDAPCLIGSAKANIGHAGAAAGIAGLIKTVLMLRHRAFVPTPHFTRTNPALDLDRSPFQVSTEHRAWESTRPRLAGVSSFGIGGTNAHLIVEEAPHDDPAQRLAAHERRTGDEGHAGDERTVLCLSAATPEALRTLRDQVADRLGADDAPSPADAAHTLSRRRSFPYRLSVVTVGDAASTAGRLRGTDRVTEAASRPQAAFLFPGQGTLRPGHGHAAHAQLPVFREVFEECRDHVLTKHGVDLRRVLDPETDPAWCMDTRHQQLGLFVHGYALARQLMAWDLTPVAMLGHSIGECVAAAVAGIWTQRDALDVVWARAGAMHRSAPGRMVALRMASERAAALLGDGVTLATEGSDHVVLSGPVARIEELAAAQEAAGVAARLLDTHHAFHSSMMTDAAEELRRALAAVPTQAPTLGFVSGLTGGWADPEQAVRPSHWADQLLGTVRLRQGMQTLAQVGPRLVIELGPGDQLVREAVRRMPDAVPVALLGRTPEDEPTALLTAVGRLWEEGVAVNRPSLRGTPRGRVCSLPPHPFAPTVINRPELTGPSVDSQQPSVALSAATSSSRAPVLSTPAWTESAFDASASFDALLLVGDALPGLGAAVAGASVVPTRWETGAVQKAAAELRARGAQRPVVIAVPERSANVLDPDDPWAGAALAELTAAAELLDAPLLLAGPGLTNAFAQTPSGHGSTLTAWAEHHGRSRKVALLDTGTGPAPDRLPVLDDAVTAYAWHGQRWWSHAARPVLPVPAPVDRGTVGWSVVTDDRPDGALLAADLAESGLPVRAFTDLTPPAALGKRFVEAVDGVTWHSSEPPLNRRSTLSRTLDLYCAGLVGRQILSITGLRGGERATDEELRRRIDPDGRLPALADFCVRVLTDEGWLRDGPDGRHVDEDVSSSVEAALAGGAQLTQLPGLKRMLDHVTAAYTDVFSGRRTPVSVLYPDADVDFLDNCLRDNHIPLDDCAAALTALRTVIREATARRGDGDDRPLRVLEIGAGAGRLTWPLLTDWPERHGVEYHVTDVSPLIVRRAQERATELGLTNMRFSTYDIGRDPVEQGLALGSYDLVIGYNVVHVAESIPTALGRLAALLRPEGRLGMVEVTEIARWSHVLWGLAPGWWDFGDELRVDSIHLDAETWQRALANAGFTDVRPVPASLASDHITLVAASPGPGLQGGPNGLLYLPALRESVARRWTELRAMAAPDEPAWVVTEDPEAWPEQWLRRTLDPDPCSPAWGHLEVSRVEARDLADLFGKHEMPSTLVRLSGPLPREPEALPSADPVVASAASAPRRLTRLAADLAALWQEVLGTPVDDDSDDFAQLGGDSLMLVQLNGLIRVRLGRQLPAAALAYPLTFGSLLATLEGTESSEGPGATGASSVAPLEPEGIAARGRNLLPDHVTLLREGGPHNPLFLVAPATGSSLCYRQLAQQLDGSRPVYGLDSPGLDGHRRPLGRLEDIAAHHVTVLRQIQPSGPYLLGGWSYGAMVGHEMTRLLEAMGERVELLVAIDGYLPPTRGLPVAALPSWLLPSVALQIKAHLARRKMDPGGSKRTGLDGELAQIRSLAAQRSGAGVPDYVRLHNVSLRAMLKHRPSPVNGPILLLKAGSDEAAAKRLTRQLSRLYGEVTVCPMPGTHHSILGPRHVAALAAGIDHALAGTVAVM